VSVPAGGAPDEARTLAELIVRAGVLASGGRRRVLGIVGAPGSGKSTLASRVVMELGEAAVAVPMDGFHLSDQELVRLGRRERKGAPDTFDVGGYVSLLRRLREESSTTVYAPEFDRAAEMSVAGAIRIPPDVPLVVTEGNYLLLPSGGWGEVRPLLDEAWFLVPDDTARVEALVKRHVEFGKSRRAAVDWVLGSDQRNSDLVAQTRHLADVLVIGLGPSHASPGDDPVAIPRKAP